MSRPTCRSRARGFTLIELMTVIGIIGILAAIAIAAYAKNVRNAHKTEVIGDLSNIALRQRAVFGVRGHYVSSTNSENQTYPVIPADLSAGSTDLPLTWPPGGGGLLADANYTKASVGATQPYFLGGGAEHGFDALNFAPEGGKSYCAYGTISGRGTNGRFQGAAVTEEPSSALGPIAGDVFPVGDAREAWFARDWFYAFGVCDLDQDGNFWMFSVTHYDSDVLSPNTTYSTQGE